MCNGCNVTHQSQEAFERGVAEFIGAVTFYDALGQLRCGLTGALTSRCGCYYDMRHGVMPRPGYRGDVVWDDDFENVHIPNGQAPLAITAG